MPTIEINKKRLFKLLGKKLSNEVLADRVAMMGTDVEGVSKDTLTVEVFPDRPDMLSTQGLAIALRGFLGIETGLEKVNVNPSNYIVKVNPKVKKVREYVVCAVAKGLKLDEEMLVDLMQIQEKLHMTHSHKRKNASIGMYDLDKITFPLTYTTVDKSFSFVPLEFKEEMTMQEILTKHPKGKEYSQLVKGDKCAIWFDKNNEVLSFPPIINSAHTAVTEKTKNLFIDVTGLNKNTVEKALNIICYALSTAGADIYEVKVGETAYPRLQPKKMKLDYDYINRIIGLDLSKTALVKELEKMRFSVKGDAVLVPSYRTDILHQIDLAEEVAISYGYENFEHIIPNVSTIGEETKETVFKRKVSEILSSMPLLECNTYNLTSTEVLCKNMLLKEKNLVRTLNNVNINYDTMRNAMLPCLLTVLSQNKHYDYPQNLFEVGTIVAQDRKNIIETDSVSVVLCSAGTDFTTAKGCLDTLFKALGKEYSLKGLDHPSFITGRCGSVVVSGKSVGVIGEIHPQVLNNFEIRMPVAGFELSIEKLMK